MSPTGPTRPRSDHSASRLTCSWWPHEYPPGPPQPPQPYHTEVRIAGQRTLYSSAHDAPKPAERFLRIKGPDRTSELIALYNVIARLSSLVLQHGALLEKVGDLLAGAECTPRGPVVGHDCLKHCTSLPDLIGRRPFIGYCGCEELAHRVKHLS